MVDYDDLTPEQQTAADTTARNVMLTAGAGTGKTTTLTARYILLIKQSLSDGRASGEATAEAGAGTHPDDVLTPDEIITTTFTERAANDLTESVRSEVFTQLTAAEEGSYEQWRAIADALDDGYIHTLHGFCSRLLREHAIRVEAVDPGFDTLDQADTDALIDETVASVIETHDESPVVRTLARRFDRSDLRAVLADLLGERPHSIEWAERMQSHDAEPYREYVRTHLHPVGPDEAAAVLSAPAFVSAVRRLQDMLAGTDATTGEGSGWQRAEAVVQRLADTAWDDGVATRAKQTIVQDIAAILTTTKGERYANYTGTKKYWTDSAARERFDDAFTDLADAFEPAERLVDGSLPADENGFPLVAALSELTLTAAAEYEQRKRRQNVVDFTDQITHALEFLRQDRNAHIRQELRDQFEYVMVDEFQDTDPRQWELIKLLTAADPTEFDADNVFVVGDVKQSIYRFRNADVSQFRETEAVLTATNERLQSTKSTRASRSGAAGHGTDAADADATDDQLSTNFRSLPTVLEVLNDLFHELFPPDGEPYEATPQSLDPYRDDPADVGSVEYLLTPTHDEVRRRRFEHYPEFAEMDAQSDTELEATALAARVTQLLAEPARVYEAGVEFTDDDDDEPPEPAAIEPHDIAILIRSRSHLKTYERALKEAGIPYTVASGTGFYESPEVTALVNLLRALAAPGNEQALYATLRSPLFGFTDDTLAQLKTDDDPLWTALEATEVEPLAAAYEQLHEWRSLAGIGPGNTNQLQDSWAVFLTRIIEDTGFLVSVSADERPDQARANVEKFRDKLREMSDDELGSLTSLVQRIERRMELTDREGEAEITGETEGVRILTIHDAKGMEFPIVVVPGLHRGFNDEASLGSGRVEFERIGEYHEIGMKAPDPDDPFEMVNTLARAAVTDRRRAEELAEERRVLYVACTRARDRLLLSGCHDHEDEDADDVSLQGLADPDPDDPGSWLDLVQPEFVTDNILEALETDERVRAGAVGGDDFLGDGAYTVSLPTPRVDWGSGDSPERPPTRPSPQPQQPDWQYQLSPTDINPLASGQAEIRRDEETRLITVRTDDDEEPTPDDATASTPPAHQGRQRDLESTREGETLVDAAIFGDLVHRLCELRAPEERWPSIIEQTLAERNADAELTPALRSRIESHARPAIDYIEQRHSEATVEGIYDEVYVTAEFERGTVAGLIDHLIVTPAAFHTVDYKTSTVGDGGVGETAHRYRKQMEAYATALHQQHPERAVTATLYFTGVEKPYTYEWEPDDLDVVATTLEETIHRHLDL